MHPLSHGGWPTPYLPMMGASSFRSFIAEGWESTNPNHSHRTGGRPSLHLPMKWVPHPSAASSRKGGKARSQTARHIIGTLRRPSGNRTPGASRREAMNLATGETRGNQHPPDSPSRRAGVNHPHTYSGSYATPYRFKIGGWTIPTLPRESTNPNHSRHQSGGRPPSQPIKKDGVE